MISDYFDDRLTFHEMLTSVEKFRFTLHYQIYFVWGEERDLNLIWRIKKGSLPSLDVQFFMNFLL